MGRKISEAAAAAAAIEDGRDRGAIQFTRQQDHQYGIRGRSTSMGGKNTTNRRELGVPPSTGSTTTSMPQAERQRVATET